MARVGVDIGGTFTDLVLVDDGTGEVWIEKVLTTSPDPSDGVVAAITAACARSSHGLGTVSTIIHGTTLGINTVIERKGSRTALLATKGHRDAVEIRREQRFDMYDVLLEATSPLAPRYLRFDVSERVLADGSIFEPLDAGQVRRLVARLAERGVEALAVSFLHSYRNPTHELMVADIAAQVAPALSVSLSCRVAPEIKEYERTATTLCNAYVQSRVARYLERLEHTLRRDGFRGAFLVMHSAGGLTTADVAKAFPVRILESGPAGGAMAASHYGESSGTQSLIAFDMGGTTAKISVIAQGRPLVAAGFEIDRAYRLARGSGIPVRIPVIEMIEIGAGGGSIAAIDSLGLIRVGPESAGSAPGPACYALGGELPTVTDADLLLGYLNPDNFLGGRMRLDVDRAKSAVQSHVGDPVGLQAVEAAWGIHRIVNENMAQAARVHLVERGLNPLAHALFTFGGAGPVHATGVADLLGSPAVIVPLGAGVLSALGFLTAPASFESVRGWYGSLETLDWRAAARTLRDLEDEGRRVLATASVPAADLEVLRFCDLRYEGQGYEVRIRVPPGPLQENCADELRSEFQARYRELYGREVHGVPLEVVSWRVIARGSRSAVSFGTREARAVGNGAAFKGTRRAYFATSGGFVPTPVYDRYRLLPGGSLDGPAIVEEQESTTIIGPGYHASVDDALNLIVRRAPVRPLEQAVQEA